MIASGFLINKIKGRILTTECSGPANVVSIYLLTRITRYMSIFPSSRGGEWLQTYRVQQDQSKPRISFYGMLAATGGDNATSR